MFSCFVVFFFLSATMTVTLTMTMTIMRITMAILTIMTNGITMTIMS